MEENFNNNFNNNYNYGGANGNPNFYGERKGLSMCSLITGIISLPMACCTGYVGIIVGVLAVLFGIFSKGAAKIRSGKAVAGIITGTIGIVLGIIMLVLALYALKVNPEIMQQYNDLMEFYNR